MSSSSIVSQANAPGQPQVNYQPATVGEVLAVDVGAINVVAEGADPTGTFDASQGIYAAIGMLGSAGGTVLFPPGRYYLPDGLVVNAAGVVLQGTGMAATQLVLAPGKGIQVYGRQFELRELTADGGYGLAVLADGWRVENCELQGFSFTGQAGQGLMGKLAGCNVLGNLTTTPDAGGASRGIFEGNWVGGAVLGLAGAWKSLSYSGNLHAQVATLTLPTPGNGVVLLGNGVEAGTPIPVMLPLGTGLPSVAGVMWNDQNSVAVS